MILCLPEFILNKSSKLIHVSCTFCSYFNQSCTKLIFTVELELIIVKINKLKTKINNLKFVLNLNCVKMLKN